MSKVRVQDATKELSASVGQLFETVSKSHKRAQEALNSLKKLEESARQKERELRAQEEAKKQESAAALTGGAYSAEPPAVPEAPAAAADFACAGTDTAGMRWYLEKGITGIRGEVSKGFPSLTEIALPRFAFARNSGLSREEAGLFALLHLIAALDDTTLLHRGGVEGAGWAKGAAKKLLDSADFPTRADMEALDDAFIARNLSPGGAADLLAVTFFLTTLRDRGFLI